MASAPPIFGESFIRCHANTVFVASGNSPLCRPVILFGSGLIKPEGTFRIFLNSNALFTKFGIGKCRFGKTLLSRFAEPFCRFRFIALPVQIYTHIILSINEIFFRSFFKIPCIFFFVWLNQKETIASYNTTCFCSVLPKFYCHLPI